MKTLVSWGIPERVYYSCTKRFYTRTDIMLPYTLLLLVGCQSINCEDSRTPASCEQAQITIEMERKRREAKDKIPLCTGKGLLERCALISREDLRAMLEELGNRRWGEPPKP